MSGDVKIRELADRLHSTALHLLRRVRGADLDSGISPARLSLLSVLVFGGPKTLGELAALEQVRPPTITGLVRGLERDGLLRRSRDRNDRRVQRVAATAKGRRVLVTARRQRVDRMESLLRGRTAAQRREIDRACAILLPALAQP